MEKPATPDHSCIYKNQIVEKGIYLFNNCNRIIYVGSGGFLSSNILKWRKSIKDFLIEETNEMTRIINLPKFDYPKLKTVFGETEYKDYCFWLLRQYIDLKNFSGKLKLHDSLKAPAWGHGFITILGYNKNGNLLKNKYVLFFTGGPDKAGIFKKNATLFSRFLTTIDYIERGSTELYSSDILSIYFKDEKDKIEEIIKDIQFLDDFEGSEYTKKISEIKMKCRDYLKSIKII